MENLQELLKTPKVYVDVMVSFDTSGRITPHRIRWEHGEVFHIDRVNDVKKAASTKGGGYGTRYTIMIKGQETYLFHEPYNGMHDCGRWYVEDKRA